MILSSLSVHDMHIQTICIHLYFIVLIIFVKLKPRACVVIMSVRVLLHARLFAVYGGRCFLGGAASLNILQSCNFYGYFGNF